MELRTKPWKQNNNKKKHTHREPTIYISSIETFFSRQQTLFVNRENFRHYQCNFLSKYSIFLAILPVVWINEVPALGLTRKEFKKKNSQKNDNNISYT